MAHIRTFGCVKNMDSMAYHMLDKSDRPLLVAMRNWIRAEGIRQARNAERRQKIINDQFKKEPVAKGVGFRRCAVIDPYYAAKEPQKHKTSWGDKEFLGSLREANPGIFPKR